MFMNDKTEELEAVDVKDLMAEYAELSFVDLIMELKEARDKLLYNEKVLAAKEFKLSKSEEELETLKGRINSSTAILNGEADICIDCEAVKERKED